MSESVLKAANRGHNSDQVRDAVALIRQYNFSLGLQMMTGLPGDTDELSEMTAREIIKLKPDFVRIYPTLTIKDTFLEKMYNNGTYKPQSLESAVELSKKLVYMFERENIDVIRVGLQTTDEINSGASVVAGPFHSSFGELVESSIYYDIIASAISSLGENAEVIVYVNPKEISKAVGNKRNNILKFKNSLGINVKIKGDINLKKKEVRYDVAEKT